MHHSRRSWMIRCLLATALVSVAAQAGAQEEEEKPKEPEPEKPQQQGSPTATEEQPKTIDEAAKDKSVKDETRFVTYSSSQGFRLQSEDGNYRLRFGLAAGIKYEPTWTDGEATNNGMLAFVRPSLSGHFYKPWIGYSVAMELASETPFLLAANVDLTPWEAFSACVGQQGTPVSRHTSFGVRNVFFADFASVTSFFWSGRQKGLTLYGSLLDGKVDYWAGLYGGSPSRETTSDPHNYIGEGRVTISPWGPGNANEYPFTPDGKMLPPRLSFTVQGYHGKLQRTKENTDPTNSPLDAQQTLLLQTMTTGGADLWLQWGRFIVFGEYYRRYVGSRTGFPGHTAQGAWGQIIANAYANIIGVGARVNWLDPTSEFSNDEVIEAEGQVAWFIHAPELVLKLRYAYLHQKTPDAATLGTFTLPFAPGHTNLVTLQLTLAF